MESEPSTLRSAATTGTAWSPPANFATRYSQTLQRSIKERSRCSNTPGSANGGTSRSALCNAHSSTPPPPTRSLTPVRPKDRRILLIVVIKSFLDDIMPVAIRHIDKENLPQLMYLHRILELLWHL